MSVLIWRDSSTWVWKNTTSFVWNDDAIDSLMFVKFSQLFPEVEFSQLFPSIGFDVISAE